MGTKASRKLNAGHFLKKKCVKTIIDIEIGCETPNAIPYKCSFVVLLVWDQERTFEGVGAWVPFLEGYKLILEQFNYKAHKDMKL